MAARNDTIPAPGAEQSASANPEANLWVERLMLTNFRNYASQVLDTSARPVVLIGANGAGKTNLLEALSLLSPGTGLRRATLADIARMPGDDGWSVAARVHTHNGAMNIGTGVVPVSNPGERLSRIVRIDGEQRSGTAILAELLEVLWVTPAMDGLFTGPASERRRFLDRLTLCFDASHRTRINRFERAMQSRNRLLADGVSEPSRLEGFELVMAESAVAVAAARAETVAAISAVTTTRRTRDPNSPFPWSTLAIEGQMETDLTQHPAIDVEDAYLDRLAAMRARDAAAGRTLDGPHRSDLIVGHGPKSMPARLCSTGEQKALLLGLILAHAELVKNRQDGRAPLLLLDEISAHFDDARRTALFAEILRLGTQAWATGTDEAAFSALREHASFVHIADGGIAS